MTKQKTDAVVLKEPAVQSNINMSLTQSDVIDVAIQTQLELLEPQLEALKKEYNELTQKLEDIDKEFADKLISKANISSHKELKKMVDILSKGLQKEIVIEICDLQYRGDSILVTSPAYDYFEYSNPEESKNPISYYRTYTRSESKQWRLCKEMCVRFRADIGDVSLETNTPTYLRFSNKELDLWEKQIQQGLNKKAEIGQQMYDLQKEILELKYNEKRVKAKVVKMALSKTKEGKNILSLLESATQIKLLSK